ncbi:ankyrin repeat-containing domain protein [Podospora conica]|nr:ankyrin repeat-containing domain protein [Schizothecium conicum]
MADPLSFVAAIVALVTTCTQVVRKITKIKQSSSSAPAALHSLAIDCTTTMTVLQRLESLVRLRPQLLAGGGAIGQPGLGDSFKLLVQAISASIGLVSDEVRRISTASKNRQAGVSARAKAKFVWKERLLKDLLGEIREHRSSLSFLLDCVHTESIVKVQIHLEQAGAGADVPPITDTPSADPQPDPLQLNLDRLSLDPQRPAVKVHLPRVLDDPDIRKIIRECRPPVGESYKQYNRKAAEALATAVERKDLGKLRRMLENRRDPDTCLPDSKLTPLHRAIDNGWEEGAFLLAAAGANLNTCNENGHLALLRSTREGFNYYILKLMCELGANVNDRSSNGFTALHCAASVNYDDEVIKVLIAHGADVDCAADDECGWSPLWFAVREGHVGVARKLLDYGCDPNFQSLEGVTPLYSAVEGGPDANMEIIDLLCDSGADPSSTWKGYSILRAAVDAKCSVDVVRKLVATGSDVNEQPDLGLTPLELAAKECPDLVPYLVEHGADVNLKGYNGGLAIHAAVICDAPVSVLECLLKAGSQVDPVDSKGNTPLIIAARQGSTAAVKILIDHGAYVDCVNDEVLTPLAMSVYAKSLDVARLLIDSGADIDVPLFDAGLRVIHIAAEEGENDLIRLLLAHGADVDARSNKNAETPLMYSVMNGNLLTFKFLVESGADPDAQDNMGCAMLLFSVEHPAMLRYLLSLDRFDVNHRDNFGSTALHEAVILKKNEMASARILLQKGAKQFHADECWEEFDPKEGLHRGTPSEIAREMGKTKLAELIEGWKYGS